MWIPAANCEPLRAEGEWMQPLALPAIAWKSCSRGETWQCFARSSLKVAGRLARPATLAYFGMPRHEISRASNAGLLDQCGSLADTRDSRQTDGNDLPDRATIPDRILLRP
jgi:hypothetical protein